ncbi:MAG: membrane dipeptidase [Pseudomonadota bacterium]
MSEPTYWPISFEGKELHQDALIWDAHSVLPLTTDIDVTHLERHAQFGVNYVSINIGMDFNPIEQIMGVLGHFRSALRHSGKSLLLADSLESIWRAKREGKLAVGFDLEGSDMLGGRLSMLELFKDLGVKQLHLIYNRSNSVGGGCHDSEDNGLTDFGRRAVAEINRLGMVLDASHAGERTSLEMIEASAKPVVFSHANARALTDHPRNISDDQIRACAASGGVIGVNGVALFLGDETASVSAVLDHIDHIAGLVGVDHVGIGLDFEFLPDPSERPPGFDSEAWWPSDLGYGVLSQTITPPDKLPDITEGLIVRGYDHGDIRKILGQNFFRVAQATWR